MNIELLAPAKNLECGIEAIRHGADAVYIGAPKYGARAAAGNSLDDLRQLASFAHQYGARVYVTLNTIIYDDELSEVESLVWDLYRIGIDALIVQDMALLTMNLPPIALHASTQTDNRTPEKVQFLHAAGFSQVGALNTYSVSANVREIVVEEGITRIPGYTFEYLKNVEKVSLPNAPPSLSCDAFNDCSSLNNLVIPASVKEFEEDTYFNRCDSLTDLYYMGTREEWAALP